MLVADNSNNHFLFVAGYRNDEVTDEHPAMAYLNEMKKDSRLYTTLELGNLSENDVNACISERLHLPLRLTRSLSEIVYKKTNGGNAFFVSQFLSSLANQGLLTFSYQLIRWEWDEAVVEATTISTDVLKVMVENIHSLSQGAQDILKNASCIGGTFSIETLDAISDPLNMQGQEILSVTLKRLVNRGLLRKLRSESLYKFVHDRIQQAAYSLVPPQERGTLHIMIGRFFIQKL